MLAICVLVGEFCFCFIGLWLFGLMFLFADVGFGVGIRCRFCINCVLTSLLLGLRFVGFLIVVFASDSVYFWWVCSSEFVGLWLWWRADVCVYCILTDFDVSVSFCVCCVFNVLIILLFFAVVLGLVMLFICLLILVFWGLCLVWQLFWLWWLACVRFALLFCLLDLCFGV